MQDLIIRKLMVNSSKFNGFDMLKIPVKYIPLIYPDFFIRSFVFHQVILIKYVCFIAFR